MTIQREKKENVKLGYIGLGRRGMGMLDRCMSEMADVEITWICDLEQKKIDAALEMLNKKGGAMPKYTTDYREVLADPTVDAIMIMT